MCTVFTRNEKLHRVTNSRYSSKQCECSESYLTKVDVMSHFKFSISEEATFTGIQEDNIQRSWVQPLVGQQRNTIILLKSGRSATGGHIRKTYKCHHVVNLHYIMSDLSLQWPISDCIHFFYKLSPPLNLKKWSEERELDCFLCRELTKIALRQVRIQ